MVGCEERANLSQEFAVAMAMGSGHLQAIQSGVALRPVVHNPGAKVFRVQHRLASQTFVSDALDGHTEVDLAIVADGVRFLGTDQLATSLLHIPFLDILKFGGNSGMLKLIVVRDRKEFEISLMTGEAEEIASTLLNSTTAIADQTKTLNSQAELEFRERGAKHQSPLSLSHCSDCTEDEQAGGLGAT